MSDDPFGAELLPSVPLGGRGSDDGSHTPEPVAGRAPIPLLDAVREHAEAGLEDALRLLIPRFAQAA